MAGGSPIHEFFKAMHKHHAHHSEEHGHCGHHDGHGHYGHHGEHPFKNGHCGEFYEARGFRESK